MLLSANAQKLNMQEDPVFSAAFYEPYEAAAAVCMEMLCGIRSRMPQDVIALQYRLKSGASIRGKLQRKRLPETAAAAAVRLTPVWILETDTGSFQINGLTGEVSTG